MLNQLQKAIDLIKKTGDKLVVFDSSKPEEEAHVIMSLSDYEKLIQSNKEVKSLTENELLDKINRDIAIWRSEQENKNNNYYHQNNNSSWLKKETEEKKETSFKKEEKEHKENKRRGAWSIPEDIKKGAKEVIEEDENQYIEEIPF